MKKNSKNLISYLKLINFLAIFIIITSCSWGGSESESNEDETVKSESIADESENLSNIDEMEAKTVDIITEEEVFATEEQMPEYPGGEEALIKYLRENLKYPEKAREQQLQGKVILSFHIQKDGKVDNIEVLNGIGGGCDEEAVRVVSEMPNWSPGYEKGNPVIVKYTLPISFVLK